MELPQNYENHLNKIEEEKFLSDFKEKTETEFCLKKMISFEFIGDDDESTEISSLLAEIDASNSRSSIDSESAEILNIINSPSVTIFQPVRTFQPKRISLNGKVLTKNTVCSEKLIPQRLSNPIFKNYIRDM